MIRFLFTFRKRLGLRKAAAAALVVAVLGGVLISDGIKTLIHPCYGVDVTGGFGMNAK